MKLFLFPSFLFFQTFLGFIKLQLSQHFCSMQNQILFRSVIGEAKCFLNQSQYFHKQSMLSQCQNMHQLFHFFIQLGLDSFSPLWTEEDKTKTTTESYCVDQPQRKEKTGLQSALSISTSSDYKQTTQLSLIQQIQAQQVLIAELKEKLAKTEKMMLIGKKLERQVYNRNIDEGVQMIVQKEEEINKLMQQQDLLLDKLKERDNLLERTMSLLEQRARQH